MAIVYVFVSLCVLLFVLRRRFDFLSMSAVSFILYTSSCIAGKTWITRDSAGRMYYSADISTRTYLLVLLQLLLILAVILADYVKKRKRPGERLLPRGLLLSAGSSQPAAESVFWPGLMLGCALVFVYTLVARIGLSALFSGAHKSDLLSRVGGLFSFAIWGILLCFFYGVQTGRRWYVVLSAVLILVTVLIGSRAYIAAALVGVLVMKAQVIRNAIRANRKVLILGFVAAVLLLLYKNVYKDIRALNFAAAVRTLTTWKTYADMLDVAEFRINSALFNYVVETGFRLPAPDSAARILSVFPKVNDFIPTKYPIRLATIIKENFFNASYGLASSFWAESYAMGRAPFLALITVLWLILVRRSGRHLQAPGRSSPFAVTAASYCCFYIHRLDWVQVCGCLKSVVFFYLVWLVLRSFRLKPVRVGVSKSDGLTDPAGSL